MLVLEYMIYNIIPCSYTHPSAVSVWKHPWRYSWEHTHERCVSIQEHHRQCLQSATTESHVCEKARWKAAGDAIRQDHRAHQENVLRPESGVCGPGTATYNTSPTAHHLTESVYLHAQTAIAQKIVEGVYPGVTTHELDELAAQTGRCASGNNIHPVDPILFLFRSGVPDHTTP